MAKITIEQGWDNCETCGSYDFLRVTCPELNYEVYGDTHLNEYYSLEDVLVTILQKLGHEVVYKDG